MHPKAAAQVINCWEAANDPKQAVVKPRLNKNRRKLYGIRSYCVRNIWLGCLREGIKVSNDAERTRCLGSRLQRRVTLSSVMPRSHDNYPLSASGRKKTRTALLLNDSY